MTTSAYTVARVRFAPGEVLDSHAHDCARICLVLAGGFLESQSGLTQTAMPGTVYYLPAGQEHRNEFGANGASCFRIEARRETLVELSERATQVDRAWIVSGGPLSWRALRVALHGDFCDPIAETVVLEFLGACLSGPPGMDSLRMSCPPWLAQLRDRLTEERCPPSLRQLASESGVHPMHLARMFRRCYGTSVGEFLQTRRIARVCDLLVTTDSPLSAIAYDLGYHDQAHLSRHFASRVGLSPGAYRRRSV